MSGRKQPKFLGAKLGPLPRQDDPGEATRRVAALENNLSQALASSEADRAALRRSQDRERELEAERNNLRSMLAAAEAQLNEDRLRRGVDALVAERDYHRTAHDGAILRIAQLTRRLDELHEVEAERDRLKAALTDLAEKEMAYRKVHDLRGDDHIEAGRAWDRLRNSGDRARAVLSALSPDEGMG